jgi:flagellar biosynthesis/type III secretory pathway protein FliH
MKRSYFVPAVVAVGLALAAPASAQIAGRSDWGYADEARQPYNESRRVAYDNGYREGVREGERDARSRDTFNYQDERTWQRADKGYHRSFGDRQRYAQSFRTGYAAGYSDSYRRYAPNYGYGGYDNRPGGVYPNARGGSGYPQGGYGYPGQGGYGYPGQGGYGQGRYYSPAYSNGVNDGYEKGREDARDRDAYDVLRHKWYRAGDRNYRSSYGPRQQYENLYRQGFKEGYDRGYREWSYRR